MKKLALFLASGAFLASCSKEFVPQNVLSAEQGRDESLDTVKIPSVTIGFGENMDTHLEVNIISKEDCMFTIETIAENMTIDSTQKWEISCIGYYISDKYYNEDKVIGSASDVPLDDNGKLQSTPGDLHIYRSGNFTIQAKVTCRNGDEWLDDFMSNKITLNAHFPSGNWLKNNSEIKGKLDEIWNTKALAKRT